ncbi:DUF3035 domain-containing protein [Yoonia vestfoldensis]|jgi:hypothetical protein|uniref:Pyruvate/2-oxoglutarate dehydrogenase complex, dihydrolipoamide acyltransferase (E2) component n=1 Tax=Yoonia vestfoldensis TaxID=245188 RepID=A0A1Y0EHI5_9RHOB|nr:DUF3035 domain-containing protein [Yoonia vestfoldensis]ARU03065.1 pyruvate/2-oxoglutarate dehydrogenase complex, dihydrolipoamide acyltransferase (E2) component [Yoonia vestfoldensis]
MRAFALSGIALALLAACSRNEGSLRDFGTTNVGPAEMSLVIADPLQMPPTLDLPPPTPGQTNRANPRPASAR